MPSVTVVVATYNAASTLKASLDSVFAQDHPDVGVGRGRRRLERWHRRHHQGQRGAHRLVGLGAGRRGLRRLEQGARPCHRRLDHLPWRGRCLRRAGRPSPDGPAPRGCSPAHEVVYGSVEVVDDEGNVLRRVGRAMGDGQGRLSGAMAIPTRVPSTTARSSRSTAVSTRATGSPATTSSCCASCPITTRCSCPDLVVVKMGAGGLSDNPDDDGPAVRETHRARYEHGLVSTPTGARSRSSAPRRTPA